MKATDVSVERFNEAVDVTNSSACVSNPQDPDMATKSMNI